MKKSNIEIKYSDKLDSKFFEEYKISFSKYNERISITSEKRGLTASYEWTIPTLVVLWFFKSYFNSFMGEMGKDHYHFLRNFIHSLRTKIFKQISPRAKIVSSSGIKTDTNKYSISFSIMTLLDNNKKLVILLPNKKTENEYVQIEAEVLNFLISLHNDTLHKNVFDYLKMNAMFSNTLYLHYNFGSKRIEIIDEQKKDIEKILKLPEN